MTPERRRQMYGLLRWGGTLAAGAMLGQFLEALIFQGVNAIGMVVEVIVAIEGGLQKIFYGAGLALSALAGAATAWRALVAQGTAAIAQGAAASAASPDEPASKPARDALLAAAASVPGVERIVAPAIAADVPSTKVVPE